MIDSYLKHVGYGAYLAVNAVVDAIIYTARILALTFCFLFLWPLALLSAMHDDEVTA